MGFAPIHCNGALTAGSGIVNANTNYTCGNISINGAVSLVYGIRWINWGEGHWLISHPTYIYNCAKYEDI